MNKKIVICGSLKNMVNIKNLGSHIQLIVPNVSVTIPDGELPLYKAKTEYIRHISEAAAVFIMPKCIDYTDTVMSERSTLRIGDTRTDINCLGMNFAFSNDVLIGESTSYEMAIADFLGKPCYIVADKEFVPSVKQYNATISQKI